MQKHIFHVHSSAFEILREFYEILCWCRDMSVTMFHVQIFLIFAVERWNRRKLRCSNWRCAHARQAERVSNWEKWFVWRQNNGALVKMSCTLFIWYRPSTVVVYGICRPDENTRPYIHARTLSRRPTIRLKNKLALILESFLGYVYPPRWTVVHLFGHN